MLDQTTESGDCSGRRAGYLESLRVAVGRSLAPLGWRREAGAATASFAFLLVAAGVMQKMFGATPIDGSRGVRGCGHRGSHGSLTEASGMAKRCLEARPGLFQVAGTLPPGTGTRSPLDFEQAARTVRGWRRGAGTAVSAPAAFFARSLIPHQEAAGEPLAAGAKGARPQTRLTFPRRTRTLRSSDELFPPRDRGTRTG